MPVQEVPADLVAQVALVVVPVVQAAIAPAASEVPADFRFKTEYF